MSLISQRCFHEESLRRMSDGNEVMLELLYGENPITDDELRALIKKRPHVYGRFANYLGKRTNVERKKLTENEMSNEDMKVYKIKSNGTSAGTTLLDPDGKPAGLVTKIVWSLEEGKLYAKADVTLAAVAVELECPPERVTVRKDADSVLQELSKWDADKNYIPVFNPERGQPAAKPVIEFIGLRQSRLLAGSTTTLDISIGESKFSLDVPPTIAEELVKALIAKVDELRQTTG